MKKLVKMADSPIRAVLVLGKYQNIPEYTGRSLVRFRIPMRCNLKTGSKAYNAPELHFRTKSTGSEVSSSHSHKPAAVDEKDSSTGAPPVALRFIAFLKSANQRKRC
jgi:hypothetical protein